MPDCPTGNYQSRVCALEEAFTQIAAGLGHPPMEVIYSNEPFSFNETLQKLTIPIPPTVTVEAPSTVLFASSAARLATAPLTMRQIGIQTTDATNGNYSLWVPTGLTAGSWALRVGSMGSQNKSAVDITGGTIVGITDLAVADGGTGASTPTGARVNLANASLGPTANNLDWALSCHYVANVSVDTAFTFSNVADGLDLTLVLRQVANANPTFPSYVKWPGNNTQPTHSAAGKTDVYFFERISGEVYGSSKTTYNSSLT